MGCCRAFIFATSLALALMVTATLAPAESSAVSPPLLGKFPESGRSGIGAGQVDSPSGVAVDPRNGDVLVADLAAHRIERFTPWGAFVGAFGWSVSDGSEELQSCGPAEPELAPAPSLCRAGSPGPGNGQLNEPTSITVDSVGNIYVAESSSVGNRVQKFNSADEFVWMAGGGVNKTAVEDGGTTAERNLCTAASGDVCQMGSPGSGPGEFARFAFETGTKLAVSGSALYVGDEGRIQKLNVDGDVVGEIPLVEPADTSISHELEGRRVMSMVTNPAGDVFINLIQDFSREIAERPYVFKYNGATWTRFVEVGISKFLAGDAAGGVWLTALERRPGREEVLAFGTDGACIVCVGDGMNVQSEIGLAGIAVSAGAPAGVSPGDTEVGDVYVANREFGKVAYIDAYGPPPTAFEPPPQRPPSITDQYAASVSPTAASLQARINPHFWDSTTYYVEYGTAPCSEGGCGQTVPAPPGSVLTSSVVNASLTTGAIGLAGLVPATTYHYRFVARTVFGGGEEALVRGLDGEPGVDGGEATFTTPPAAVAAKTDCPNQAFRVGHSAPLPDCRAYEMVSPVDKSGGDVLVLSSRAGFPPGLEESSTDGGSLTYTSYRAFAGAGSAPYASEYLAHRVAGVGWGSESIATPREGFGYPSRQVPEDAFELQFKAFSPDLSRSWLLQPYEPVLQAGTPGGYANLYRRDAGGSYEALVPETPPRASQFPFYAELQGVSGDGACAVFRADDELVPQASARIEEGVGIYQVYENCEGNLRLVSFLPAGTANETASSTGTAVTKIRPDRSSTVAGAVSRDGSRIYWTAAEMSDGPLYLRVNAQLAQSKVVAGKCSEAFKACTLTVSSGSAHFWQADPEGTAALFSSGGTLYRYELTEEEEGAVREATVEPVMGGFVGFVGASTDLSRVYLVSTAATAQEEAEGAVTGRPNLYLAEGGTSRFVALLSTADAEPNAPRRPSLDNVNAERRLSRTTPSGGALAFMATSGELAESTAGYDNTDPATGEPAAEVYLYEAATGTLRCASCDPSGARPTGPPLRVEGSGALTAAARIPGWQSQLLASRVLSDDGRRLFFESYEPLVARDTDGVGDVYEWEVAGSEPECLGTEGGERFANGGCLSLISSGEAAEDSEFVDADPSGADVFIRTGQSLLPQDPGQIDIYDAREGGGFPAAQTAAVPCNGQACQGEASPSPGTAGPGSTGAGAGNPAPRLTCPKGTRKVTKKGTARCIAKKKKKPHKKKDTHAKKQGGHTHAKRGKGHHKKGNARKTGGAGR